MAEEGTEISISTSSSKPNWWPDLHVSSSWSTSTNPWHPQNPPSSSSMEEDVSISTSFTNVSNHSGLTAESSCQLVESGSTNELIGESASDNHLWSHVFLNATNNGEIFHSSQDSENNMLYELSSKNDHLSSGLFEPAFDYLKKMDHHPTTTAATSSSGSWEFVASTPAINHLEKQTMEGERRLNKLTNLVRNWSIAPPEPRVSRHLGLCRSYGSFPGQEIGLKAHPEDESGDSNRNGVVRYQNGYGVLDFPYNNNGNCGDVLAFNGCLNKPSVDVNGCMETVGSSECLRPMLQVTSPFHATLSTPPTLMRSNYGKRQGNANEGKKKRSEENSQTVLKKPKHENSVASSAKMQVPKVKLGEKITALQQIVSPFGKTDTASVLWEAISYIKFLQEQVQLLSNPYMKTTMIKEAWGGMDRKERGMKVVDLKSRGLCLVPISCTPQIYREINNGSDYWSQPYRGSLYR